MFCLLIKQGIRKKKEGQRVQPSTHHFSSRYLRYLCVRITLVNVRSNPHGQVQEMTTVMLDEPPEPLGGTCAGPHQHFTMLQEHLLLCVWMKWGEENRFRLQTGALCVSDDL